MNKTALFTIPIATFLLLLIGCGQSGQKTADSDRSQDSLAVQTAHTTDSIVLMQTFEKLKTDKTFLKDLALENEKQFSWNDNMARIIPGDLDGDGIPDALLGFTVEGRGGGNNYDLHYAVFLKENNGWTYQGQFDGNAGSPEHFYGFKAIENGIVKGAILDNKDDSYEVPVEFIFRDKSLVNIYTALHKTETGEREYISISEILTPENVSVPLTASLSEYQKLLGKGEISQPKEQPECGTYFDEGVYSELHYPHLVFELSDSKKATFKTIVLKNSGLKLQTGKGTITEKTTFVELKNILNKNDSWLIDDEENGSKTISIPDGEESDNQLHILFDKNGNIVRVMFFVPC